MTNEERSLQHLKCINILLLIEENKKRTAYLKHRFDNYANSAVSMVISSQVLEDKMQLSVGIGMRLYGWYKGNLKKLNIGKSEQLTISEDCESLCNSCKQPKGEDEGRWGLCFNCFKEDW